MTMTREEMNEACDAYYKEGGMKPCGEDFLNNEDATVDVPEYNDIRFYRCYICGQIVAVIGKDGNPLTCCGKEMTLLEPNTTDADGEKHVPLFTRLGHKVTVKVGMGPHPMTPEHHIEWICLVTCGGIQWKYLNGKKEATATFRIASRERVAAVYAYCNMHGLWRCC